MKKLAAMTLAVMLMCSVTTASAKSVSSTENGSKTTDLKYSVEADYAVEIPETVNLDERIAIISEKANTQPGMAVIVRISEGLNDGMVTLSRDGDEEYQITVPIEKDGHEGKLDSESQIAVFQEVFDKVTGAGLSFGSPVSPDDHEIKAGAYMGTLTFKISYEDYTHEGE